MLKQYRWLTLLLSIILTGCLSLETEPEANFLNNDDWPTPVLPTVAGTATPFPTIALADLTTPTPTTSSPRIELVTPQGTRVDPARITLTPLPSPPVGAQPIVPAATAMPDGPPDLPIDPAAGPPIRGEVTAPSLNVRTGPGATFEVVSGLQEGDEVVIVGVNSDRSWAWVLFGNGQRGWVSANFLDAQGQLTAAPVIDADNLPVVSAPAPPSEPAAEVAPALVSDTAPEHNATLRVDLTPRTTARINQFEVDIHPGPSLAYAPIDDISDNTEVITVLALDTTGEWVLVDPAEAETGWIRISDLAFDGSYDGAPIVRTAWIKSSRVSARHGPGLFYDYAGDLFINTLVLLLGRNDMKSWALVQPLSDVPAVWVSIRNLGAYGPSITDIPQAPQPPLEPANQVAEFGEDRPVVASTLVFQRSSGGDILAINSDGTNLRYLTTGIDPSLSPDGQQVAFTRWPAGEASDGQVWVINLDGSGEREVHGFVKQPKGPEWSPDSTRLAINHQQGGYLETRSTCEKFVDGEPPTPPYNAGNFSTRVEIEDDGDLDLRLCWNLPPDPWWNLRVINLGDGRFEDWDGGTYAFRPAWDPVNPWRIVTDGGLGLLGTDVVDAQAQPILLTENVNDGSPTFSPDGRYIAVTTCQQSSGVGCNIHRLNRDGGGRVALTRTELWQSTIPDGRVFNNVAPAWSPDGYHLAFLTDRTGRWEVWVMTADGSHQRPLFDEATMDELNITYNFVDERSISWR